MGRSRRVEAANSLVASAARIGNTKNYVKIARTGRDWQPQAWEFYNTIGEFRYACDWVGSMLSKAILYAVQEEETGKRSKVTTGPAYQALDALFGDSDGRAEMLRTIGIHFTVAGECYLVGYEKDGREHWQIVASTEIRRTGKHYSINGERLDVDADDVLVIRLWRPHPQKAAEAISPARSVMSILAEISKLTDHVAAQVDSRLAGAGILLMPSEMTLPPPPQNEEGQEVRVANTADQLMQIIQNVMATAIEDRSDASALVPIVITAPADAIEHVKHLTFWTELDEQAIKLRDEAIRRLALGMDMPPEVLTGVSDANHWAAWQADESAIKGHTEPLLKIITSSLAEGYLRPILEDENQEGVEHFSIDADTSEMRLRPNRSKEAMELYDRGELGGAALLRETGFDPEDAMDDGERQQWFLRKVASGSTTPELVEAALRALKVPLPEVTPAEETQEERPVPSLLRHPEVGPPDRERGERRAEREAARAALVAASEQIVVRALERAGNKLKNRLQARPNGVPAANLYKFANIKTGDMEFLLNDAWSNVPSVAGRYNIPPEWLEQHLDSYCRILLGTQQEHNYDRFTQYMEANLLFVDEARESA